MHLVIRSDDLAGARTGLIELLLAGRGNCLEDVSLAVTTTWSKLERPTASGAEPAEPGLLPPFDALARQAESGARSGGPCAQGAPDGGVWASIHQQGDAVTVVVAAVDGEALASVDLLWHQAVALCRRVLTGGGAVGERKVQVTLHFTRLRLRADQQAAASESAHRWEADRDET